MKQKDKIKLWFFLPVLLAVSLIFIGCSSGEDSSSSTGPEENMDVSSSQGDSISILSIDPKTELEDGADYTFTVKVIYTLATLESAELNIGFNNDNAVVYTLISGATETVETEAGEHTFSVTTTAKHWSADVDFQVYVNLAENLGPDPSRPVAEDIEALSFE